MDKILLNLEKILEQRKTASSDKSYVASLYNEGTKSNEKLHLQINPMLPLYTMKVPIKY